MHWIAFSVLGLVAVIAIAGILAFATGRAYVNLSPFYSSVSTPWGTIFATSQGVEFQHIRHLKEDGIDTVEPYVNEFLASTDDDKLLGLLTGRKERLFMLKTPGDKLLIEFYAEPEVNPCGEESIRAFFEEAGVPPSSDVAAVGGSVRYLTYPINVPPADVAAMVTRLLTEVCGVDSEDRLEVIIVP